VTAAPGPYAASLHTTADLIKAAFDHGFHLDGFDDGPDDPTGIRHILAGRPAAELVEVIIDAVRVLQLWMRDTIVAETEGHAQDHVVDGYVTHRVDEEVAQLHRAADGLPVIPGALAVRR
jgi:hypothetical protein